MSGMGAILAMACVGTTVPAPSGPQDFPSTAPPLPVREACEPLGMPLTQAFEAEDLLSAGARPPLEVAAGPGLAVADFDIDGDLDLVVTVPGGSVLGLENDGSGTLALRELALDEAAWDPAGVAAADLDGDARPDLVVASRRGVPDRVLLNRGGWSFSTFDLPDSTGDSRTPSLADVDGDGDLDLFISGFVPFPDRELLEAGLQEGDGNRLYLQEGPGAFTEAADRLPAEVVGALTYHGAFLDVDGDGDLDLYLADDYGNHHVPNRLLLNDGTGRFAVAEDCACDPALAGMGVGVADLVPGDGPDLYLTDFGDNWLYRNLGDGTYVESTLALSALPDQQAARGAAWGVAATDLDGNARPDLAIVFGQDAGTDAEEGLAQRDALLLAMEDGFVDATASSGFADEGTGRAVVWADLDGDGRNDLVASGTTWVHVHLATGGCGPGITLEPRRPAGDFEGIGARIEVVLPDREMVAWHLPSTTFSSASPWPLLGLDGWNRADRVTVWWPDGAVDTWEEVAAGTRIVAGAGGG